MRRRISIRGCVRRSVRRSVTPSFRRLLGASYAEYSALLTFEIDSLLRWGDRGLGKVGGREGRGWRSEGEGVPGGGTKSVYFIHLFSRNCWVLLMTGKRLCIGKSRKAENALKDDNRKKLRTRVALAEKKVSNVSEQASMQANKQRSQRNTNENIKD